MRKVNTSYKANGLRRASERYKAVRSMLVRVELRSVATGEVTYRSHVMHGRLGWKTFFATIEKVSRDEFWVDLVLYSLSDGRRSCRLEVASSEIENY